MQSYNRVQQQARNNQNRYQSNKKRDVPKLAAYSCVVAAKHDRYNDWWQIEYHVECENQARFAFQVLIVFF